MFILLIISAYMKIKML